VTKLNKRSQLITAGVARSPNRAMLRAVGFKDGDFEKPIVGVANGHSTMNPCNAGIEPLVDRVVAALREAGAMPQTFGFPTVTDGIGMGTEGMKYSLVSREVIADSIEVAVNGQRMDGVVAVGGCDKNMPGSVMAMARMNVPGIFVYAGTIKPGFWKGQKLTIVSPFEAVGAFTAGKMSKKVSRASRKTPARRWGRAAANTPRTRCRPRSKPNRFDQQPGGFGGGVGFLRIGRCHLRGAERAHAERSKSSIVHLTPAELAMAR
jgi:dihydroxyacid dehydratase/phosphogluconate dehydratase